MSEIPADATKSHTNGINTDTTTFSPDSDAAIDTSSKPSSISPASSSTQSPQTLSNPENTVLITLTHDSLSVTAASTFVRSPTSGATVLFLGTTRSYFQDPSRPVSRLSYSAYSALALRTLMNIATTLSSKHGLERVYIAHRLGEVAVAEESIVIAVSAPHRGPAWAGAEECLELVKQRAEIWKREWFVDGDVRVGRDGEHGTEQGTKGDHAVEEVGVWRDNRESDCMGRRKADDVK